LLGAALGSSVMKSEIIEGSKGQNEGRYSWEWMQEIGVWTGEGA